MNFAELSSLRYSVRKYADTPIEEEKLSAILEAGRLAPTAGNRQPQQIYVLKSEEAIARIRKATRNAYNAPVVLLVCYDSTRSWKAANYGDDFDSGVMDASIVTTAMMMQAAELGIGSLWVRGYGNKDILNAVELPENIVPVCLLDLGYPAEDSEPSALHTSRLPLDETVAVL